MVPEIRKIGSMQENKVLLAFFKNSGLSEEDLRGVVDSFERREFKKNEFVLKEGQVSNEYYILESGFMRAFAIDYNGNEISTGFYASMTLVLEVSSFFLRIPSRENIQTVADCVCWRINFDRFQELFHGIQAFREAGRARLVNGFFALKKRSLSMVTDSAETRYLQLLSEHPEIFQHVSLKHIATYLGITDTSLSRIRKELAKK